MPFPECQHQIEELVQEHAQLADEPLLVAIYFDAQTIAPDEECLFEVADNFGFNEIDQERHIFQIQFGASPEFPLPENDRLRLFLTNPVEFKQASEQSWQEIEELKKSIQQNRFQLLYHRPDNMEAARVLNALGVQTAAA